MKRTSALLISIMLLLGSCSQIDGFREWADPIRFGPLPGEYTSTVTVTLYSNSGLTVTYTTDGTDPRTSPTAIIGTQVLVDHSLTITAYAKDTDGTMSENFYGTYIVK